MEKENVLELAVALSGLRIEEVYGFRFALSFFLSTEDRTAITVIADYLEVVDYSFENNSITVLDDNGFKLYRHIEPDGTTWMHVDDQLGTYDTEISIDEILKEITK